MAVRLISSPGAWARLRPASDLACLTVPGLISTPRRRPRRPEDAFPVPLGPSSAYGCVCTSDITSAYPTICHLTHMNCRLSTVYWQQPGTLSAPTPIERASTRIVARMAAKMSLRIQITSFAGQTSSAFGTERRFNQRRRRQGAPGDRLAAGLPRPRPSLSTSPPPPQPPEIPCPLRSIRRAPPPIPKRPLPAAPPP